MWKRQRYTTFLFLWLTTSLNHALLADVRKRTSLSARRYTDEGEYEREIPTETLAALPEPDVLVPAKPKIVVLGATGKIGRLVVQQLLEHAGEATIVALVRDYDKACRVLYDDMMYVNSNKKRKKTTPTLQIVEANLVPSEELPGYRNVEEQEEDEAWQKRASSAAAFYGTSVKDYANHDNSNNNQDEVLEEAIRGCTAVISCVGSVRPTNLWTDFLKVPFVRIWRKDVSAWCSDPRHPYYTNYVSTRKALALAEKEQLRRQSIQRLEDEESTKSSRSSRDKKNKVSSRIRFVRISDLCLSQQPWHFVPLLTNIMHSMVFRYQDMTEQLLHSSTLIDTIILRPGDLSDDERNVNTTALQVDPSGRVPSPSRVGREDVASLALSSALFRIPTTDDQAMHYTLAVRWVGEQLHPYPAQGSFQDGFCNAHACLRHVFRTAIPSTAKRRIQPYALCTAIPVYAVLFLLVRSLTHSLVPSGRTFLLPLCYRICNVVALLCGILAGQGGQPLSRFIPRFGKSAPKFISF